MSESTKTPDESTVNAPANDPDIFAARAPYKAPDVLAEIAAQQVASRKRLDDEHAKVVAELEKCRARVLELIARRDEIDRARREMRPRAPRRTKKSAQPCLPTIEDLHDAAQANGGGGDE